MTEDDEKKDTTTLEGMMRTLLNGAQGIIGEGQQMTPVFMTVDAEDKANIMMAPWGDREEKRHVLNALRGFMQKSNVVRYAHASEAWVSSPRPKDGKETMPSERPADERTEVVILLGVEMVPERRVVAKTYTIDRATVGKPMLVELEMPGVQFDSALTRLLEDAYTDMDPHVRLENLSDVVTDRAAERKRKLN